MTAATDLMTTAVEQGIAYWAEVRKVVRDNDLNVQSFDVREGELGLAAEWKQIDAAKINAAAMTIVRGKVQVGRQIAAQFVGWPEDYDDDADSADVAVQIAAFGQIIFS